MKKVKERKLFIGVLVFSLLMLLGSFVITFDSFKIASNPNALLNCDFSSNISCSSVAKSPQAEVFGFPNSFLGLMFSPVLVLLAVLYLSGSKIKNWVMLVVEFLSLFSLFFALWLFFQSAFVINALCPWCLLVLGSTILMNVFLFRFNSVNGLFGNFFVKLSSVFFEFAFGFLLIFLILGIVIFKYFI